LPTNTNGLARRTTTLTWSSRVAAGGCALTTILPRSREKLVAAIRTTTTTTTTTRVTADAAGTRLLHGRAGLPGAQRLRAQVVEDALPRPRDVAAVPTEPTLPSGLLLVL
jgi:hypothetical protein